MSANFTPTFKPYINQTPMRFWCQHVLPLVYDDSLSYYEVLAKLTEYINYLIEDIQELATAYESLQEYVNSLEDDNR